MTRASKIDAAGDQADIVKPMKTVGFSKVLEVWGVILEAWEVLG